MIAAVRIRGTVRVKADIKRTLELLKLKRPNHCIILEESPSIVGMLKKAKDYVTWGEINEETLKRLLEKDGIAEEGIKGHIFRLRPPRKGYRSVRLPWPKGDLGYRGKAINELLKRMI